MDKVVLEVKKAISQGVHPKLIVQGSSGSYFVRNCAGEVRSIQCACAMVRHCLMCI